MVEEGFGRGGSAESRVKVVWGVAVMVAGVVRSVVGWLFTHMLVVVWGVVGCTGTGFWGVEGKRQGGGGTLNHRFVSTVGESVNQQCVVMRHVVSRC